MDRCKISEWKVVLGAPDRVNIPCLVHDTCLCQLDDKMTNISTEPKIFFKYKTCYGVKTGEHSKHDYISACISTIKTVAFKKTC